MHILQPKHTILKQEEVEKLLIKYNISLAQLPKIKTNDPALPKEANIGDVIEIQHKDDDTITSYFRVVVL